MASSENKKIKDDVSSFFASIVFIALLGSGIYVLIRDEHWIILSLIILGLVATALFLIFILAPGLEAGFRKQFPLDYEQHLQNEIAFFTNKGYLQVEYIDPGSEHPGILMSRENSPQVKIILNAPIAASDYSVDVCIMTDPVISAHYDVKDDIDLKHAKLSKLLEII